LSTKAEELAKDQIGGIYSVYTNTLVPEVWKKLIELNISSAAVFDENQKRYLGFIDIADIVNYLVRVLGSAVLGANQRPFDDLVREFATEVTMWRELQVKDVIHFPHLGRNSFRPVMVGQSAFSVLEPLAREPALRRIAILNDVGTLVHVVTQSMAVKWVNENILNLGRKEQKPVEQMEHVMKTSFVVTEDRLAIDAFQFMIEKNVTALPVVDSSGQIKDVISLKDIKLIRTDQLFLWRLYQGIPQFMHEVRKQLRPKSLQVLSPNDTLGKAVRQLAEHRVHRLFVVDEKQQNPMGVVSLKEVIAEILKFDE
jgi:CBS domain-containing protein